MSNCKEKSTVAVMLWVTTTIRPSGWGVMEEISSSDFEPKLLRQYFEEKIKKLKHDKSKCKDDIDDYVLAINVAEAEKQSGVGDWDSERVCPGGWGCSA